jgi:DNA polymerase-3 subunit beta
MSREVNVAVSLGRLDPNQRESAVALHALEILGIPEAIVVALEAVQNVIREAKLEIPVPADVANELTMAIRTNLQGEVVRTVGVENTPRDSQQKVPSRIRRILSSIGLLLGTCREMGLRIWTVFRRRLTEPKTLPHVIRIKFDRARFLSVYQTVALVACTRSGNPILRNVKLEVDQEYAVLTATDLEIAIRLRLEGMQVQSPGCVLLPEPPFGSILRESSDNELSVEGGDGAIHVRGLHSDLALLHHNPDEYPNVVPFPKDGYYTVKAKLLNELTRRTLFATGTQSTEWAFGAVLLEMEGNRITAVATDGQRLAKMACAAECPGTHTAAKVAVLVPARSLYLIGRAPTDPDAEILLLARPNDILFRTSTESVTLYSRLAEGPIPEWRHLFSVDKQAVKIEMTAGRAYSAIREATIVTDDENHAVAFTFGDNRLVLTCSTAGLGQARIELPLDYYRSPVEVTLDYRFVVDFLRVLDPKQSFTMEVETERTAVVFRTDDGYCYVVMPLVHDI